jgi:hypothetical protein
VWDFLGPGNFKKTNKQTRKNNVIKVSGYSYYSRPFCFLSPERLVVTVEAHFAYQDWGPFSALPSPPPPPPPGAVGLTGLGKQKFIQQY